MVFFSFFFFFSSLSKQFLYSFFQFIFFIKKKIGRYCRRTKNGRFSVLCMVPHTCSKFRVPVPVPSQISSTRNYFPASISLSLPNSRPISLLGSTKDPLQLHPRSFIAFSYFFCSDLDQVHIATARVPSHTQI